MVPIIRKRGHEHYRWKVYLFFWSTLAFVLGYMCGLISSYVEDESVLKTTENSHSEALASTSRYSKISAFLTVGILSGAQNSARRQAIRETWLNMRTRNDVHHVFVIGTKGLSELQLGSLQNENEIYNDLLLLQTGDSYHHLSQKILSYFTWLDKTINFTFVLKCDDDSFVHLENLYYELTKMQPENGLYWGFFDGRAHIKKTGRWTEKNWFLSDHYLPYAEGGGYVLSHNVVSYIAQSSDMLSLYNSEDVSVGVWTAPLKLSRIHDPRFDTEFESRGCFNSYLITHKQSLQQMKKKHENIQRIGVMCSQEFRSKKSYIYNWSVPPSMCCTRNNSKVP